MNIYQVKLGNNSGFPVVAETLLEVAKEYPEAESIEKKNNDVKIIENGNKTD